MLSAEPGCCADDDVCCAGGGGAILKLSERDREKEIDGCADGGGGGGVNWEQVSERLGSPVAVLLLIY